MSDRFHRLGDFVVFMLVMLTPGSNVYVAVQFFIRDVAKTFLLVVALIYVVGILRALLSPDLSKGVCFSCNNAVKSAATVWSGFGRHPSVGPRPPESRLPTLCCPSPADVSRQFPTHTCRRAHVP